VDIVIRFLEVILAHLVGHEISAWSPKFSQYLIRLAVNRVPEPQRDRYFEEWQGHLEETPGAIGKCIEAVGFVFAALAISGELSRTRRRTMAGLRRVIDVTVSLVALLMLGPVLLLIAAATWIETGSWPFIGHIRVGPDLEPFVIHQFRVSRFDHKTGKDKTTRLGHILIQTSLHEIPEFFDVLRGALTLVGPRPVQPNAEQD
jgi:hypothetical protein